MGLGDEDDRKRAVSTVPAQGCVLSQHLSLLLLIGSPAERGCQISPMSHPVVAQLRKEISQVTEPALGGVDSPPPPGGLTV